MEKKELTARGLGIGLLVAAVLFLGINTYLITGEGYYMVKLTLTGFVLLGMGLGMVLFPGPIIEVENTEQYKVDIKGPPIPARKERVKGNFKDLWKSLRILDKTMWVIFTLFGLLLAYFYFDFFGLTLVETNY
ncbi:MAG: hypothetical protein MK078_16030 [Crocinitomicaceae bacterium]|nr:hypothetical protein [Crocinitomicaceae bacterium]